MNIASVPGGPSAIADLTRLVVAAQATQQPQDDTPVAVEALQLRTVKEVASGSVDTYA